MGASTNASIKLAVLIWLVLQNSVHTLLLRYSRARDVPDMFFSSVAVFLTEIVKIIICLYMVTTEEDGIAGLFYTLLSGYLCLIKYFRLIYGVKKQIIAQPWDTLKVCIPAMLYTIQNNLFYAAASHLEAATFMAFFF